MKDKRLMALIYENVLKLLEKDKYSNNLFVNRNDKCLMNIGKTILTSTIKKRQIKWMTREFFNHDINRFLNGNILCCTLPYTLGTMYMGITKAI